MEPLKVALAKGRLANNTIDLLERTGMDVAALREDSRKLVLSAGNMEFFLVKPTDVPVYVEHGVADIGICGKDTLMESGANLYEMLDLGFGACKLCLAGYPGTNPHRPGIKVATKYPNTAQRLFRGLGESIEIIKLMGSVELGPILGLSDVILDIVESGRTLAENGLVVLEECFDISARLVVNRVSLKTKVKEINALIGNIKQVMG